MRKGVVIIGGKRHMFWRVSDKIKMTNVVTKEMAIETNIYIE